MLDKIRELREQTGAGVMEVKKALEEARGEVAKAVEILKELGLVKAAKRRERKVKAGVVFAYVHQGRIGVLVELNCETDFVAKTAEFGGLAKELAMQIASMNPRSVKELLEQDYIRDMAVKVEDLVNRLIAQTGENIQVKRFVRYALGE